MIFGKTCIFCEQFLWAKNNDDYDDLTLVTICQSGIDEGFINMIVLTRQIINQWLNYKIMNASAATQMILQKKYLVQWMIALIGTRPNRRRNLSPLVTNIIAIQCPLDPHRHDICQNIYPTGVFGATIVHENA